MGVGERASARSRPDDVTCLPPSSDAAFVPCQTIPAGCLVTAAPTPETQDGRRLKPPNKSYRKVSRARQRPHPLLSQSAARQGNQVSVGRGRRSGRAACC